jgi:N-acetylglucosaminyldiphosphoundecaprenol N-acetyl-beta-D-mannosaminyltransferase
MNKTNERIAKMRVLISKINSLEGIDEALNKVAQFGQHREPIILSFINAHAVNMALENTEFYDALMDADVLLRDGVGVELLMKVMSLPPGHNLNGTDFITHILTSYAHGSKRALLLGTKEPYLAAAAEKINQMGLDVVGAYDGFLNEEQYLEIAEKNPCELIVLGMGMPKQERVAMQLKQTLEHDCLIVNGGAIIDFLGGKVSRAPAWIQRIRCEWIYRLVLEPSRLWRRYILGGFRFAFYILQLKFINYKIKL